MARAVLASALACLLVCAGTSAAYEPECILPSKGSELGPTASEVSGNYSAVSESEWALEVALRPDGSAEMVIEAWEAGRHAERSTHRYRGSWTLAGQFVLLRTASACDTLRFDAALRLESIGVSSAGPGLTGVHSLRSSSRLLGLKLWRRSVLDKHFPVD